MRTDDDKRDRVSDRPVRKGSKRSRKTKRTNPVALVAAAAFAALALAFVGWRAFPLLQPEKANPLVVGLEVGNLAPDIEGEDADGVRFKLSDYRGKVVLLDFWGDWCPHCREMYEQERKMVKRLEGRPFAIVGVNSDPDRAELKAVLARERITWRSFFDGGGDSGPIARQYNVAGWPKIWVLDGKGVVRYRDYRGPMLDAAVEALVYETEGREWRSPVTRP